MSTNRCIKLGAIPDDSLLELWSRRMPPGKLQPLSDATQHSVGRAVSLISTRGAIFYCVEKERWKIGLSAFTGEHVGSIRYDKELTYYIVVYNNAKGL